MRIRTALVALALPLVLATACGSDADTTASDPGTSAETTPATSAATSTEPSPSGSATPTDPATDSTDATTGTSPTATPTLDPSLPACADVWQRGAKLKASYQGCNDGDVSVPADRLSCSSGQFLVRYDDRFWAVLGGTIAKTASLDEDKGYRDAIASCRA